MKAARRQVVDAGQAALRAGDDLRASLQPWQDRLRAHRVGALLGGGFASGLALALLPLRWWSRAGSFALGAAARAARSAWLPLPFGRKAKRNSAA